MVCPVSWERVQAGRGGEGHGRAGKGEEKERLEKWHCLPSSQALLVPLPITPQLPSWCLPLFWKQTTKL